MHYKWHRSIIIMSDHHEEYYKMVKKRIQIVLFIDKHYQLSIEYVWKVKHIILGLIWK